ncbi:phosphotransferase [Streptomyces sp. NPDC001093]|uniref:phosphotransferase family protein n=1 Tax=Streptomyces sp. NPDC001093 TaxID=3154376 RepID=UPI0033269049
MSRHLEVGERILRTEALHGGITAELRRLTIGTWDGGTRDLVLRSFVDPCYVGHAEDWLNREAGALTLLAGTRVPTPGLVAVDPTAAHCAYPSLLMTHLAGRTVLDDAPQLTPPDRPARCLHQPLIRKAAIGQRLSATVMRWT